MHYIHQLHHFAGKSLRGHYAAAWGASMLCLGIRLIIRLIPMLFAGILILNDSVTPGGLFGNGLWLLFMLLWESVGFCILLPVKCGTRSWFTHLTELEQPGQERTFFRNTRSFGRGICFFGTVGLMRWIAALPFAAGCMVAVYSLRQSIIADDGGLWLFAAVQGLAGAFWGLWGYLRFGIRTMAVPYLFLNDPSRSAWSAVQISGHILTGRYRQLALLLLPYCMASLPVVTIPFLLPRQMTELTMFFQLCIRETAEQK